MKWEDSLIRRNVGKVLWINRRVLGRIVMVRKKKKKNKKNERICIV